MRRKIYPFFSIILLLLLSNILSAQPGVIREVNIKHTDIPVNIDGILDEPVWQTAQAANNFWNQWPDDSKPSEALTEVKVAYDETYLYFAAVCIDSGELIVQTLKRDQMDQYWGSDAFAITLDPVNRKSNGFLFGVNANGAQIEGLLSDDPEGFSLDWDNKWYSAVKQYPDKWVVEIAIPFKTLRYDIGNKQWGMNFIRNDMKRNMYSAWSHVPVNFAGIDLGYTGRLNWEKPPPKAKGNISLIPYVSGSVFKDYEEGTAPEWKPNAGLDAKIAVTPSLNLDLTINPDFSQVEVDQQVTNLDRFDLFFPERRTFFLENSDLFTSFGIPPTRPFFSRRIGLNKDAEPIPILFGARLSGNISDNWRIGLMSVQTKGSEEDLGQNYTVGAFQRRIFKRSSIRGIIVNRQGFDGWKPAENDYGRNGGLEFSYVSEDGSWGSWAHYHYSLSPEKLTDRDYYNVGFFHSSRNIETAHAFSSTGTNFLVDAGFNTRLDNYDAVLDTTIRLGYAFLFQSFNYNFYPENSKKINRHGPNLESIPTWNPDFTLNEWPLSIGYDINFTNQSNISAGYNFALVNLPVPTDLIDSDVPLPVDQYNFMSGSLSYSSDGRKKFTYNASLEYGSFYNGTKTSYGVGMNFRVQPWGNFGLNLTRDVVELAENYGSTDLILISPRIEVNFAKNIFWTTFLQYNTQAENFNINSRFQWRFKPMSDLFVVYTDNYLPTDFSVKNRALVVKLNYWFTL